MHSPGKIWDTVNAEKQATKQHLQENPVFEKKNIYEYVS